MTSCHPDVCPHMHFNKCYDERIRSIPVSFFPDPTIDSFSNVNVKIGKQYKSNIPTTAYQKYISNQMATNDDRNFVKDFYMENYEKDKMILNNNIVNQLKQEMYKNSAYILAQGATKDYEAFQENRKKALINARTRAKSTFQAHKNQQKELRQKNYEQNGYWLKKLFRKLEQVAQNIIQGSGQNPTERQKQFLLSKSNLTANFLSQIKIRDPKNSYDILQEVRVLMQKKKLRFFDQREEQERKSCFKLVNQSVTQSFASETSQNTTQNSMLSEATSLNQSNMFGQDQIVQKFWDFDQLKKKWKLDDIQDVREMIRRMFSRKVVYDAEVKAVKQRKQSQKMNKQLLRIKQKIKPKKDNKKPQKIESKKRAISHKDTKIENENLPVKQKGKLSKQQESAKEKIIKGGRFDAIGEKFMRNKTYSEVFKNKQNQITTVFIAKEQPQITTNYGKDSKLLRSTTLTMSK